jgi:aspartyl-tRNA(Asn)/glutamyl-tRNA(Gln) amidotransferase subunit B
VTWEIVVGIETHAQLLTRSKMFSGASTEFGAPPNTQASAVDIALPGVLPVPNRVAVEHAIRFGLAVNGTINRRSILARKNYFYPDLPKGYQISQYELPIVQGGYIEIPKKIRITRAHLEEDAGKSLHEAFRGMSGIDLNRAGTPLLEIVSEPDLRSAQEAAAYARTLHRLVTWIGICDGNMQEGSFRCDANVSVRRPGEKLGTRCEIKNLNSFRFMEHAIEFEARRQIEILEAGGTIEQETRLYDPDRDETRSMRTKEEAHDYRYFPDPDLLPLMVSEDLMVDAKASIMRTGTPESRRDRLVQSFSSYGLTPEDAQTLTQSREMADYFETVMKELDESLRPSTAKIVANFILGELAEQLNRNDIPISKSQVKPQALAGLIKHVIADELPVSTAKKHFPTLWSESAGPAFVLYERAMSIPEARDHLKNVQVPAPDLQAGSWNSTSTATVSLASLWPLDDSEDLERIVDGVLATNAKQVEDYRAGKEKAFNSLVGQVMKATQGKANPAQVNDILRRKLKR